MVVPPQTIDLEMQHASEKTETNNFRLNDTKSVEFITHTCNQAGQIICSAS